MHSINLLPHNGSNSPWMRPWKAIFLGGAILLAALSACAVPLEPTSPSAQPQQFTPLPSPTPFPAEVQPPATRAWEVQPLPTPPAGAERVPALEEPLQGEVPPARMSAVLEDAMQRAGVGLEAIQVLRAEAVEWPDGSLGCPSPGMEYLQVITPGYWVELQAGDTKYDYRVTDSGYLHLCESALPVKP